MWLNSEQVALTALMFQSYVTEHHRDDILQILHQRDEDAHYSLVVNAMTLFEANMEVAEYFNAFPGQVLSIFDEALHAAVLAVSRADARPKRNLHVRVSGKATDYRLRECLQYSFFFFFTLTDLILNWKRRFADCNSFFLSSRRVSGQHNQQ